MEQGRKKLATESFVYKTVGDASEAILKGMELMFEKQEKKLVGRMDEKVDSLSAKMDSIENSLIRNIDRVAEIVTITKTNHERRLQRLEDKTGLPPMRQVS